jgi:hypothetical protein
MDGKAREVFARAYDTVQDLIERDAESISSPKLSVFESGG